MCGIAGCIFTSNPAPVPAFEAVQRMVGVMRRRGPDAEGIWPGEGVVLGHCRLAILDLDARANQPLLSNDGRYAIVFNGEIYNFRELRRSLEADGATFRTASDTEVLLALFAREGERMLPKLRGMFAFGIWDNQTRELFLARDPYGIKPLYYTRTGQGLAFGSQVKALLASGFVSTEQEPAGLAGFYLWGSVPEPWTLYRDVFALPAGHWLRAREGMMDAPVCWHDIRTHWQMESSKTSASELRERVRQAVRDSVRAHLVADVPVSVFLSGGIDSGAIAGLAAEMGAQVEGITIGFEEFAGRYDDEVPAASAIAAHYEVPHHVRQVTRTEFEQDLPRILDAMDQPSVDGVNTWFASKAAAELGYKVTLSGVGGDELFCGYPSFRQIPRMAALARAVVAVPGARALLSAPCAWLARLRAQPKFAGIPEWMDTLEGLYFLRRCLFLPGELPALMGAERAREGLARLGRAPPGMTPGKARDGAAAVGLLESTHYLRNQLLRDSDWASMGHSLELRTPLVDAKVLDTLGPCVSGFTGGAGKAMLARSPAKPLPDAIIHRPKTGFGLPMAKWLSAATADKKAWAEVPMLAVPGTPWARRWAKSIVTEAQVCV
ncbi:asparagine synthase (glutamine-hydrolyzing) [Methylococcus mesophilus]|uniref:asparagine synthase (glutamine-hydrolyzing) n=1 Tax=Methylococcus mesophilus TaxID=2993564 RepID=UPI00224ADF99|nr:asparagine synthase (glutamine-hydrolyzing) [Methylococcus mesophilus]UZR28737.1 asparagine synthase (glutamine-hydrolyzing) [Methylococcus mesophilus]